MQFTDALIASRLGATALAAITPAAVMFGLLSLFGTEALTSVTTHVSQAHGRKRTATCGWITWQGIYCGAVFGLLCLLYIPTAKSVFGVVFATHPEEMRALEISYFQISLLSLAPLMVSAAIGNFFTGIGRTGIVLRVTAIGVAANVWLSCGLVFGKFGLPALGFQGLATGTLIATILQSALLFGAFILPSGIRIRFGTLRAGLSWKRCRHLIRTGVPTGLHGSIDFLAWGVYITFLIGFYGEAHLAAQTILVRCITLSFLPADGLATALTTLVGQCVGARDYLGARRYARSGFLLIVSWMAIMALVYLFFGETILRALAPDESIVEAGKISILWVALFQIFDAMNVTYTNALTGAGDTRWPSLVNLTLSLTILGLGGLAMLTWGRHAGSAGIWAVATAYITCQGFAYWLRWRSRVWQDKRFLT